MSTANPTTATAPATSPAPPPASTAPPADSLEAKLADVHTGARTDLEIHRQIHDGAPVYVLHDPQGFQSHRFSVGDYRVFCSLHDDIPLSEVFRKLVANEVLGESNKEDFYRFVVALRQLNLLKHTEVSSTDLYEKHRKTRTAAKKGGLMRLLSIKIPLANPDAFLTRTMPLAGILFSKAFACIWLAAAVFAIFVLCKRAADFAEPLNGLLAAGNIPYFLFSLIGLKIWHELGHGYACKKFGGRVPEMGTILMMGMPLAYVDASATYSFKHKYQRLLVMLGGMYFESIFAIIAVFVWAFSGHSFIGACAYQTIITASLVTVLFNANPLMRYDGYFVLVELLGITNLRQVATAELSQLSKKLFLGIQPKPDNDQSLLVKYTALLYAIASGIYSNMLAFGIATVLAYKLPQFGLFIASYYLYNTVGKKLWTLVTYLRSSDQAKASGLRARLVLVGGFCVFPLVVAALPAPNVAYVSGVLSAEHEERVRVKTAGLFERTFVTVGQHVQVGDVVAKLDNPMIASERKAAAAELQHITLVRNSNSESDRDKFTQLSHAVDRAQHMLEDRDTQQDELTLRTAAPGFVAQHMQQDQQGRMLEVGEIVCTIVGGAPRIRCYLTEEQLLHAALKENTKISFCFAGQSSKKYTGHVTELSPATVTEFNDLALTTAGGESILIDSSTGMPIDKVYSVEIDAENAATEHIEFGRRATIRFPGHYEPLAWFLMRKLNDFAQSLNL